MIVSESILRNKSKEFAKQIVYMCRDIKANARESVLTNQLLRSGTSIGANIAESECAISEKDFLLKIYTSLKECSETLYWLDLLYETEYLDKKEYFSLKNDCDEIKRMLSSTTKTMNDRLTDNK